MNKNTILNLDSDIKDVKGIGPKKAEAFYRVGIHKLQDVLYYYPRLYEDLRNPVLCCNAKDSEKALFIGNVLLVNYGRGYGRKKTLHVLAEDSTGRFEILFFMAGYMKNAFKIGEKYSFYGKVKAENGRITMFHPSFSPYNNEDQGILPVYSLTRGLNINDFRKLSKLAISILDTLEETIPENILTNRSLYSLSDSLSNIHYPEGQEEYKKAKYRLIYEELLDLKAALAVTKEKRSIKGNAINSGMAKEFVQKLPFELTSGQRKALDEILSDMHSDKLMNRLLQGDVGSGKTAVAMAAISEAVFAGYQALFMAPTDILARQHYESLKDAFKPFNVNIVLLTSSLSSKERREVLTSLKDGSANIAVGTHALISESVEYSNVGLVITDEQHRFGVSQREKLSSKGNNPDILVMTATPIPRTLAVVIYADLDVSIIDSMPKGRLPIKTFAFKNNERKDAYKLMFDEISKGHQAYIVAPIIEESETINSRSAENLYAAFVSKHPDISCGLLHGELSQSDKDNIMSSFANGHISVLISTVVIEVGIDVPNATVMIIENSERFGLAQMHQLRGRVGRGKDQSYCLICSGEESEVSIMRSKILCESNDGFYISEKDLEIRGPGEFFGLRQHGLPQLVLANPVKHKVIADEVSDDLKSLLADDPQLLKDSNACLRKQIENKYLNVDNLTI